MTFKPPSGTTSVEEIRDDQIQGYTFTDRSKQRVQGGAVRQIPQLTGEFQRLGARWPEPSWDQREEFPPRPNEIKGRWGWDSPNTDPAFSQSRYWNTEPTGDPEFLFQTAGGALGKTVFPDGVDNATGYVLETRIQVEEAPENDGFAVLFDDGTIRGTVKINKTRAWLAGDTGVAILADFNSSPRDLRMMIRDDDFWMWVEGAQGLSAAGALTGSSSQRTLQLGAPTGQLTGKFHVDYFYQYHKWIPDIPQGLASGFGFDTDTQRTTLPIFYPAKSVSRYQKAIVQTSHGEDELEIIAAFTEDEDFEDESVGTLVTALSDTDVARLDGTGTPTVTIEVATDAENIIKGDESGGSPRYFQFSNSQFKDDHYVELEYYAEKIVSGGYIADPGTSRMSALLRADETGWYFVDWLNNSIVLYKISRNPTTDVLTNDGIVATASPTKGPVQGQKLRAEIRGFNIVVSIDLLDGNGFVEQINVEDSSSYRSTGKPGFFLADSSSGTIDTYAAIAAGNFEGETNTLIGTTRLRVERSTDRGTSWSIAKTVTIDKVPQQTVDLTDVTPAGGGVDALRFSIEQTSPGGLAEAIRVEQITVKASYEQTGLELYPNWGQSIGGTVVAASLRNDARLLCGNPPPADGQFTDRYTTGAGTSLTGDYVSSSPIGGFGNAYGSPTVVGSPTLGLGTLPVEQGGDWVSLTAQEVWGNSGEGLIFTETPATGLHRFKGYLQVLEGSVAVRADTGEHIFRKGTYVDSRELGILFDSDGSVDLELVSYEPLSHFKFRRVSLDPVTISGSQGASQAAHKGLETWVRLDALNTGENILLSTVDPTGSAGGFELGLNADGRPYFKAKDTGGTFDAVTGEFPVVVGEKTHLMGQLIGYNGEVALQIYQNGELNGHSRTSLADSSYGAGEALALAEGSGSGAGTAAGFASTSEGIRGTSTDAERVVVELGYTNPTFQLEKNWPVRSSTRLLADFDRSQGTIWDRSGYGNHPVLPEETRRRTVRGADGYYGRSIFFVGAEGGIKIPKTAGLTPDTGSTWSFFFKGYTDPTQDSKLIENGYEIGIDTGGRLYLEISGLRHTHTGQLLGVNSWRPAWVKMDTGGEVTTKVGTSAEETGMLTGATTNDTIWVGRGGWGLMDELAFHRELLGGSLWNSLTGQDKKYTPNEPVLVRGVQVDSVKHTHIDRKFVQMPTGALGDADVTIQSHGKDWISIDPFLYTLSYDRKVDEVSIRGQVCAVKSPFRIGARVPDGAVNLALMNAPDVLPSRNMSYVDKSAEEVANIAFYNQGDFVVTGPEVTGENSGEFAYPPSIDTEEIRISNRSVMRKNFKQPRPLFYMHLIGYGKRYVWNPDADGAADIDLIRQGLRIETDQGVIVPLEDFAWDIEVQTIDYYQNALPANHFSVVLYCERIPFSRSLFVVYDSADARRAYRREMGRREVLNPVPIFTRDIEGGNLDAFEYAMDLDTGGSYSLRIKRT